MVVERKELKNWFEEYLGEYKPKKPWNSHRSEIRKAVAKEEAKLETSDKLVEVTADLVRDLRARGHIYEAYELVRLHQQQLKLNKERLIKELRNSNNKVRRIRKVRNESRRIKKSDK